MSRYFSVRDAGTLAFSLARRYSVSDPSHNEEADIAKGQKTSNREVRKPKAVKAATAPPTTGLMTRGMLTPVKMPRKSH